MTSVAAEPPSLARKWALPSRRLIVLFALPLPLLLVFPGRGTTLVAVVYDVVLLIAALADAWLPPRANDVAVSREARPSLALGANQRVEFRLRNGSRRPVSFELVEDLPPTFIATPEIVRGVVSAESRAFATHDVRPTERGLHVRGHVHVRFASLLGLVVKRVELRESAESKVYPNVVNLARHELATRSPSSGSRRRGSTAKGATSRASATTSPATTRPTSRGKRPRDADGSSRATTRSSEARTSSSSSTAGDS
jgi:uncharacterized protein (DUF58 family)